MTNTRLIRLEEKILDYNYTIEYVQGEANAFADVCSRQPLAVQDAPEIPRATSLAVRKIIYNGDTTPHNHQKDVELLKQ